MKKGILHLYWRIVIKPHIGSAAFVLVLMVSSSILGMMTVGLGVPLLEAATKTDAMSSNKIILIVGKLLAQFGVATNYSSVIFSLIVLVCTVWILNSIVILLQQYGSNLISKNLHREVKKKLFERTLKAQFNYLSDKSRGALIYNVNGPATSVFQVMSCTSKLLVALSNSIFMVALMFYLSWKATVAIGLFGLIWVQRWRLFADKRSVQFGRELYDLESRVSKLEVDAIDGLKVVKSNNLIPLLVQRQWSLLFAQLKPYIRLVLLTNGVTFVNDFLACTIVVALGGMALVLHWVDLSFPELLVFFVALRRISPALAGINAAFSMLNKEKRGVEMIDEILNTMPLEQEEEQEVHRVDAVSLNDVYFSYPQKHEQRILNDVNLHLRRGEITALVGSTGSGKSTLANLLVGFYRPLQGSIAVNGVDLNSLNLDSWRSKVGYVSQDIFLFNDTIKNNISLWNDNLNQAEIEKAASLAQMHDFISGLPEGYNTIVGDRGLRLSGGQAQRVAIARAILKKPDILIFDEATSALDNLTEKAIYDAIHSLHQEAIVLVIAHRLTTIREADQIAVLENGKVVELGVHDALIQLNSVYAKLYRGAEIAGSYA